MAEYKLLLPSMGEGVMEATVITWLVNEGDTVNEDDSVVEIATDKVDSDVPTPVSGKLVKILKNKDEPYSLIYFSDHGLKHIGTGSERTLAHGGQTYESFTVPFAKISSDDTEHKVIKVQRSAFNFLKGFSQWTGIQTDELYSEDYDFFSDMPDLPSDKNNLDQVNKLPKDPPV